jgi:hypothetical protein
MDSMPKWLIMFVERAHDVSGHRRPRVKVAVIRTVPPQQGQMLGSKAMR